MNARSTSIRPHVQVMDCTIRDGGLVNDHQFSDDLVRAVYRTCVEAGIDCMEMGYKACKKAFPPVSNGRWRYCDEEDVRRIVGDNKTPMKLSIMADAGKCDWQRTIEPKRQSVIDIVRVAFYADQLDEALDMIRDAHEKGYEVSANLMSVSNVAPADVDRNLKALAASPCDTVVVVDSNGSLFTEDVERLVRDYARAVDGTGKQVGLHAHNNLQLAFANTLAAMKCGATRVDATMAGMGRGAGNCPMELLLNYLRHPRYALRPVLRLLQSQFVPLSRQVDWGPSVPYNITGFMNVHPRAAIAARCGDDKDQYVDFYDKCLAGN